MLGSIGLPEILFIFILALLIFGPKRLPGIGRSLGRAMGEFRKATNDLKRTWDVEAARVDLDEPAAPSSVRQPPAAVPRAAGALASESLSDAEEEESLQSAGAAEASTPATAPAEVEPAGPAEPEAGRSD